VQLGRLTLGELGAQIEFSVHNWMHLRWCAAISEFRPDPDPHRPTAIAAKWDRPSYDWLGDFYSSHVNSIFWKLHGWVDARIDDWARANGVEGPIAWKGTWVGKLDHEYGMNVLTGRAGPEADAAVAAHAAELDELIAAAAAVPGATGSARSSPDGPPAGTGECRPQPGGGQAGRNGYGSRLFEETERCTRCGGRRVVMVADRKRER
jgi:hypothetical protein